MIADWQVSEIGLPKYGRMRPLALEFSIMAPMARTVKKHTFGPVQTYELGFSPIGRPYMTVYLYFAGSAMIDTGQSHMRSQVLEIASRHTIDSVLLTHHHEDHSGNARRISDRYGVPIFGSPECVREMARPFQIQLYEYIIWGASEPVVMTVLPNTIDNRDYCLQPISTPGHCKDHTVYLEANQGWLFSGDLYLGDKIKFFRADERIIDEIRSIKKILRLDFEAVFCSHHPKPTGGKARMRRKLQFLEDLYGNVANLWSQGKNAAEIMEALKMKEATVVKWFSVGNVSAINGVRSIIQSQKLESQQAG